MFFLNKKQQKQSRNMCIIMIFIKPVLLLLISMSCQTEYHCVIVVKIKLQNVVVMVMVSEILPRAALEWAACLCHSQASHWQAAKWRIFWKNICCNESFDLQLIQSIWILDHTYFLQMMFAPPPPNDFHHNREGRFWHPMFSYRDDIGNSTIEWGWKQPKHEN